MWGGGGHCVTTAACFSREQFSGFSFTSQQRRGHAYSGRTAESTCVCSCLYTSEDVQTQVTSCHLSPLCAHTFSHILNILALSLFPSHFSSSVVSNTLTFHSLHHPVLVLSVKHFHPSFTSFYTPLNFLSFHPPPPLPWQRA